jgi:hypothetical protein
VADVEIYDPLNETWTPTNPLQAPRGSHSATRLPNGRVLVAGGTDFFGGNSDPTLTSAEIYDPVAGSWISTGSMNQPRQSHSATLLPSGRVLVAGGVNYFGANFPTSAELFDPASGRWSPTFPLTSGRSEHFTALLPNGKVLVAGGFNDSDTGVSTELFDSGSAVPTPPVLVPSRLASGGFQFAIRNTPGLSFTIWATTNLALPLNQWTNAGNALEHIPGYYQFTDSAADSPQRFYQARFLTHP